MRCANGIRSSLTKPKLEKPDNLFAPKFQRKRPRINRLAGSSAFIRSNLCTRVCRRSLRNRLPGGPRAPIRHLGERHPRGPLRLQVQPLRTGPPLPSGGCRTEAGLGAFPRTDAPLAKTLADAADAHLDGHGGFGAAGWPHTVLTVWVPPS